MLRDGLTEDYFVKLYQWIESNEGIQAIAGYLMRYPISISLNSPPRSTTHNQIIENNKPVWQYEIEQAIADGELGARCGFVIPKLISPNVPNKGIDKFMKKLGYFKCKPRVRISFSQYRVYTNNILLTKLTGTELQQRIIASGCV